MAMAIGIGWQSGCSCTTTEYYTVCQTQKIHVSLPGGA